MKLIYQIPRNSLAWLLVAQAVVIVPHIPRLPGWLVVAWLVVAVWRIQVFRGVWAFPRFVVKAMLIVICSAGLILGYGNLYGLEPMVALLLCAFTLKLLEMYRKRDALVVIYLGYFVVSTQFLFAANLVWGLYGLLCIVLLTTALMGLNQSEGHRYPTRSFKLATVLVLQCFPLMVLLFVVMPRTGALWKVPFRQSTATTGVSDSMSPGDFSRLAKSGGLAFRVTFDGDIPPSRDLYWRGLVFSDFDGRRWTQADPSDYRDGPVVSWVNGSRKWEQLVTTRGAPIKYQVTIEPTNQVWLYALATPKVFTGNIGLTRDFRLIGQKPVRNRFQYRVSSYPSYTLEAVGALPNWQLRRELQLPAASNPQSRQQAQLWMLQAGSAQAYIERVLGLFGREFTYTLKPPLLGKHTVDEFLWQTKRGFCEHFSSSFVFLMRAAGIPARVVAGYQGGEVNPLENYLLVHQYDAHAWAEVWLRDRGWVRVDPTAAVAPDRVEYSLQDALDEQESLLVNGALSLERYRHIALLNTIRLRWDALNYNWHRWVIGYDAMAQAGFLKDLLGEVNPLRLALLIIGTGGAVLLLVACSTLMRGSKPHNSPATKLYLRFTRKLARAGIPRSIGEAPGDYACRVSALRPDLRETVTAVTDLYEQVCYHDNGSAMVNLRRAVQKFSARRRLFSAQRSI